MRIRAFVLALGVATSLSAATHQVQITGFTFSPSSLTINAGDAVQWTNNDSFPHTATSDTPGSWTTPTLGPNQTSSPITFASAGSFPYHCNIHQSMTATITVNGAKAPTTTTLESSANPSVVGQNATLTATVSESSNLDPTGTVTFTSDAAPLCSNVALNAGTASCSTAPLSAGNHSIEATYSGDANFDGSTSTPLVQVVNTSPPVPTGLLAFAPDTTQVVLSWNAVSGATYEVQRKALDSDYAFLLASGTNGATDTQVSGNNTYVYKVKAMVAGASSAFSAPDAATTIVYTDASPFGIAARALHITQLRTGVSAMRAAAGLTAASFTDDPLSAGTVIQAAHITELRDALDAARTALGLPALVYPDSGLGAGTTIRATHITSLRAGTQ